MNCLFKINVLLIVLFLQLRHSFGLLKIREENSVLERSKAQ